MPFGQEEEPTRTVGRRGEALQAIGEAGVHLLLAGHYHHAHSSSARDMVETAGPELVIQAGSATSTRVRGNEKQSFNWIEIQGPERVELRVFGWSGAEFLPGKPLPFAFDETSWRRDKLARSGRGGGRGVAARAPDLDLQMSSNGLGGG